MRRITSLLIIAALLSVSALPMLPLTSLSYAAESNGESTVCHTGAVEKHEELAHLIHGKQSMGMHHQNDEHQTMQHESDAHKHGNMNHQSEPTDPQMHQKSDSLHKHKAALSPAEKECRIECGCGCNRSVDGFPQALSPHLIPTINFETDKQIVHVTQEVLPVLHSINKTVPSPPPKHF